MKTNILIIEDDKDISDLISLYLTKEDFSVVQAYTGEEGLAKFKEAKFDLLLLDLNLPGEKEGYQVLKEVREVSHLPIVICSAREADEDIIRGFFEGADEFISKPFSPRVLVERVKAHLRRFEAIKNAQATSRHYYQFGDFKFYVDGYYLEKNNERVQMASRELDVLCCLLRNAGTSLSVWELYDKIWGIQCGDVATVAVHIQRIRKKIESSDQKFILTTYGSGYQFDKMKVTYVGSDEYR